MWDKGNGQSYVLSDREPEAEADACFPAGRGGLVRSPGGIGPGEELGLTLSTGTGFAGQALYRHVEQGYVVGGSVGAGVARPQQPRQGFARGHIGAVQEAVQRVKTEGFLPGRGGTLFFGVGDDDRGIEVEHQLSR